MASNANAARSALGRPRYRKNIRGLTEAELNDLRRAFDGLYDVSATRDDTGAVADPAGNAADERGYQWIAGVHGAPPPIYCKHGSVHFVTWHRAYLYYFEKLLQDQVATVTLPWWDWTDTTSAQEGLPAAVTAPTYIDAVSGEKKANPLLSAYSQATGDVTARSPGSPAELAQTAAMVAFANSQTEFGEFNQDLENPHNFIHGWVGGDMGSVPTAAYDPVFWLHHANVDRLWAIWQQEHPNAIIPEQIASFVCAPFSLTGADVLSTDQLGYSYVDHEVLVSTPDLRVLNNLTPEPDPEAPEEHAAEPTVTLTLDSVATPFQRATLEFVGLTPPVDTVSVHVFFNHPDASTVTPRTLDEGFAGTLNLFGHGHCLGGPGHCDVIERTNPFDHRDEHHLTTRDMRLDVSFALARIATAATNGETGPVAATLAAETPSGEAGDLAEIDIGALALTTRR